MKILRIILVIILMPFTITFAWDPNQETDLVGYRLYCSSSSGNYIYGENQCVSEIMKGTQTITVTIPSRGMYYWVLTAFDSNGNESEPSNELKTILDRTKTIVN